MSSFQDACAFDDPICIAAKLFFQSGIGNDLIGYIAACRQNLHAHKAATSRSLARRSFFAHETNHEIGPVLPLGNEMNPKP